MTLPRTLIGTVILLISSPLSWAETDARSLLKQCLPDAPSASYRSRVTIDITHKKVAPETHHYTRLKDSQHLLLSPESQGGYGYFRNNDQHWLYNASSHALEEMNTAKTTPGLLSESLFDVAELETFELNISNHNTFGGQNYYTVTATHPDSIYPKRSLSFKQTEQQCNIIRAAYFGTNKKLAKKIFFQWKIIDDNKLLKALHVEDAHTLEAVRYHIEGLEAVTEFTAADWPSISTQ